MNVTEVYKHGTTNKRTPERLSHKYIHALQHFIQMFEIRPDTI